MSVRGPQAVDERQVLEGLDAELSVPDEQRVGVQSRRPLVAGAVAGLWALMVGLALITCVVMLVWAVSPNSTGDAAAAWQAAGLTWLAAHLVPLEVAGEPLTLLPIGGLLLGLLLARRSGAWTGRLLPETSVGEVLWLVLGAATLYGLGGAVVAWLSAGESASAAPGPAGAVTGAVAAVGVLWGIAGEARLVDRARVRLSDAAWRTAVAGLAAVVGLFAAGAVLATVSLVRHFADVATTLADLDPGILGAAGVTLVDALSLPNLAIWAAAVIVGPGFQLGGTGGLSAFGGEVESLPALPVLAAIPTSMPAWAPALMLLPVVLGVLAGRIRWGRDLPTPGGAILGALGLAVVVAPLTAGMLRLSMGALGADRLAEVGPDLLPVTGAATGLVLLGFLGEAGFQSLRLSWDLHRAERRAAALRAPGPGPGVGAVAGADEPVGVVAEERDAVGVGPDGPALVAQTADGPAGAGGWAQGARRSVGRRVAGAGASAVSVVTGVGGAARTAAAGVGAAIAGTRGNGPAAPVALAEDLQAEAERTQATQAEAAARESAAAQSRAAGASTAEVPEESSVVDVRDDEIDLRAGAPDEVVADDVPVVTDLATAEDVPVVTVQEPADDVPVVTVQEPCPVAGDPGEPADACGPEPDQSLEVPAADVGVAVPTAVEAPAESVRAGRLGVAADDDTAEIPVVSTVVDPEGEPHAGPG